MINQTSESEEDFIEFDDNSTELLNQDEIDFNISEESEVAEKISEESEVAEKISEESEVAEKISENTHNDLAQTIKIYDKEIEEDKIKLNKLVEENENIDNQIKQIKEKIINLNSKIVDDDEEENEELLSLLEEEKKKLNQKENAIKEYQEEIKKKYDEISFKQWEKESIQPRKEHPDFDAIITDLAQAIQDNPFIAEHWNNQKEQSPIAAYQYWSNIKNNKNTPPKEEHMNQEEIQQIKENAIKEYQEQQKKQQTKASINRLNQTNSASSNNNERKVSTGKFDHKFG